MYRYAKAKNLDRAADYSVRDCIECGACNYVCPSRIPLAQYFKQAKVELAAHAKTQEFAAASLQRFTRHEERLARQRNESRNGQAMDDTIAAPQNETDLKNAAVQAALVRARARRANQDDAST